MVTIFPKAPTSSKNQRWPAVLDDAQALDLLDHHIDPRGINVERANQERLAVQNIAFYLGKQYFMSAGWNYMDPTDDNEHRVRHRVNKIVGAVDRTTAKIMGVQGNYRVAPGSDDRAQRHAAVISEHVRDHINSQMKYISKKEDCIWHGVVCGSGYARYLWDPDAGDKARYYHAPGSPGEVYTPRSFDEQKHLEDNGYFFDQPTGDLSMEAVSPLAFYQDTTARSGRIEDCTWAATHSVCSREVLYNRYGEAAANLEGVNIYENFADFEQVIAFISNGGNALQLQQNRSVERDREMILLTDFWEIPLASNDGLGRHVVRAGRHVLDNGPNPHAVLRGIHPLPFVPYHYGRVRGRWWGLSMVENLTPSQFQLNVARSIWIEFQNVFGYPPIFMKKDQGVPADNMALEPGLIHEVDGMLGNQLFVEGPKANLNAEILANSGVCDKEIEDISHQTGSFENFPKQVRSGAAFQQLFQERDMPLSGPQRRHLEFDALSGRYALGLAQHFMKGQRIMQYTGDSGDWQIQAFSAADLNNDVRIIGEPFNPETVAAEREKVLDLVGAGVFDLPPDQQVDVLKAARFNSSEQAIKRRLRGEERQEAELQEMLASPGKYPLHEGGYPIEDWEPHEDHARVLADFLNSPQFQDLEFEAKALVAHHWQLHQAEVEKAKKAQIELMIAMKGAQPGGAGKASQPRQPAA